MTSPSRSWHHDAVPAGEVPYIPESRGATPTRVYVVNAGEMTLMAELYDSVTNTLLARVMDRQRGLERGLNELQIANRVTNTAEADRILGAWAKRLRDALDKARADQPNG